MSEVGCLKDVHCQNLSVSGDIIIKKKVVDITTTPHVLDESQSGTIFTLNMAGSDATSIVLPVITSSNVGIFYEFVVVGKNTGGYNITCGDTHNTTGDLYVGGMGVLPSVADAGAMLFISAADNDANILLKGGDADGGGEIGSYIKVVAIKYSSDVHSHWMVTGIVGGDDNNGDGTDLFADA